MVLEKLVFVGRKNGLCNRLEMLMAAYAFRRRYGHSVTVDWPDATLMSLPLVRLGAPQWWRRLTGYGIALDSCDLDAIGRRLTVDVRSISSISGTMTELEIRELGALIKPADALAREMHEALLPVLEKPVVGVHIRQGDFVSGDDQGYRAIDGRHTRLPIWWYEWMMARIAAEVPEVVFLLCVSGEAKPLQSLMDTFNCVRCNIEYDFAFEHCHFIALDIDLQKEVSFCGTQFIVEPSDGHLDRRRVHRLWPQISMPLGHAQQ